MNLYAIDAMIPMPSDNEEIEAIIATYYAEANTMYEAMEIIRAAHALPVDGIVKAEVISDHVWKASDNRKGKGHA